MSKLKSIPDDLSFVVDDKPIYLLAQHFFAQHYIYFDINQVIGLSPLEEGSSCGSPINQSALHACSLGQIN